VGYGSAWSRPILRMNDTGDARRTLRLLDANDIDFEIREITVPTVSLESNALVYHGVFGVVDFLMSGACRFRESGNRIARSTANRRAFRSRSEPVARPKATTPAAGTWEAFKKRSARAIECWRLKTQLRAACVRNPRHVLDAANAGATSGRCRSRCFEAPLTDTGVKRVFEDLAELGEKI